MKYFKEPVIKFCMSQLFQNPLVNSKIETYFLSQKGQYKAIWTTWKIERN